MSKRLYVLTPHMLNDAAMADPDVRQKVWDYCKQHGVNENTVHHIVLDPASKTVHFYLASGVEQNEAGELAIKTVDFPMPMRSKPTWVDLCEIKVVA